MDKLRKGAFAEHPYFIFLKSILQVIVWTNYPDSGRCYYFYALTGLLSPQLFILGLLHCVHRSQTTLLSSFLTRWQSRQQQLAKIILGAILSLGNFSFTALQLHFLAWPDEETNNADYGLRISGLIITICLTLIIWLSDYRISLISGLIITICLALIIWLSDY